MFGLVGSLAAQMPTIAVLVVGIVLALMNREQLGRASTLTLIGLVLFLADLVVGTGLSVLIPTRANEQGWVSARWGSSSVLRRSYARLSR